MADAAVPAAEPAASSIDDVLARLQSIDAVLPASDGLACFNRMYRQVTVAVRDQVQQGLFTDAAFMAHLDVVFANRYFAAVDTMSGGGESPTAWKPLLTARTSPGIEPVQYALAGMNAHINFDLPLAVVATCADLGTEPDAGSHHDDYTRVDTLLDAAEQHVRQGFEPADVRDADRHVAAVANVIANWNINTAREFAWNTAFALWEVRDHPLAGRLITAGLARTVAMASRALLVPV